VQPPIISSVVNPVMDPLIPKPYSSYYRARMMPIMYLHVIAIINILFCRDNIAVEKKRY
jgi:hypothetical protein